MHRTFWTFWTCLLFFLCFSFFPQGFERIFEGISFTGPWQDDTLANVSIGVRPSQQVYHVVFSFLWGCCEMDVSWVTCLKPCRKNMMIHMMKNLFGGLLRQTQMFQQLALLPVFVFSIFVSVCFKQALWVPHWWLSRHHCILTCGKNVNIKAIFKGSL